ncbi:SCO family protein [Pelomicrobium methylotrophicum]
MRMLGWRFRFAGLVTGAALALGGCDFGAQPPAFKSTDVTGSAIQPAFRLVDHTGTPRTLEDFRGKVVVVFFGFTHCPDVCPTTLTEIALALKRLPPEEAQRVQVLFITVDPERDTPEVLAQYVPAFHPGFLGLTGDAAAVAEAARSFKVFYQKQPGEAPGSYSMDHSAGTYVFDPQGRLRLYVGHGQGAEVLAHDIRLLLAQTG